MICAEGMADFDFTALFIAADEGCSRITLITSLSTFFIDTIDNLITGVYNLFAEFFGFEKTDSVFGEIKRFVVDTYNGIVEFFSNAFNFAADVISGAWTSTKDFVQGIFDGITSFFTGAFSWSKDLVVSTWEGLQNFAGNAGTLGVTTGTPAIGATTVGVDNGGGSAGDGGAAYSVGDIVHFQEADGQEYEVTAISTDTLTIRRKDDPQGRGLTNALAAATNCLLYTSPSPRD